MKMMPKTVKIIVIDTGAPKGEAGRSFVGGDPDPRDRNGHATNVAEVILARAPEAQLVFFKAIPKSGHGSPTDLANALFAAAAEEPDIVNVSLAVPRGEPRLRRAVKTLRATGAIIVCGAGNDAAAGIQWPARYQETVSVGALGTDGKPARFSPAGCDLMLPGDRVPVRIRGHGTAPISGTSIACAVASGLLASAMASGARDALEEIRNYSQSERTRKVSLKTKLKSKLEKLIDKWLQKLFGKLPEETPADNVQPSGGGGVATTAKGAEAFPVVVADAPGRGPAPAGSSSSDDAIDFSQLDFCWGGFNGSAAALKDGCRIASLKVSGDGLSYRWARGGCEQLGAPSSDAADCLACLFCRIAGRWQGGKFDWISTSRTTRDSKNIRSGYHGWDPNAIGKADAYTFVIVSRNGKARSNVIAQGV